MDVQVLAELYGGLPERVVARAREVLRLARAKSSIREDVGTPVACLVVACRALDEPIDVKKMARLLSMRFGALDQAARKIANLVNLKSSQAITPTSLCIRHGCSAITEFVNRVYDEYQVMVQQLARGNGRGGGGGGVRLFDPADPVFATACLYACAKRAKLKVDRQRLIADTNANPRAFEAIVSAIEKQCQSTLSRATGVLSTSRASAVTVGGSGVVVRTERASVAKTKAAQRAAMVLDKAVTERAAKTRESKAMEQRKVAMQNQANASVTPQEYQAWRSKVLALRRQMEAEGRKIVETEIADSAPEQTIEEAPRTE